MLIFDQLKKNDPQLRLLAMAVTAGFLVLVAGLWWVQVVSVRDYRAHLETQAFRTVRIPAVRGKIFDRTGMNVLAENQPTYNVSLYLEELREQFQKDYQQSRPREVVTNALPFWKAWLGATPVRTQYTRLKLAQSDAIIAASRYRVASNTVLTIARRLQQPLALDFDDFQKHYHASLYVPYPVAKRIDATSVARFEEQFSGVPGVDLEIQSTRFYPHGTTASHLLGYLRRDNDSIEGEWSDFSYRLPDYRGVLGIEGGLDAALHGRAGEKSILVNYLGYRQTENIWTAAEAGSNVVLTIDLQIQQAAENALKHGPFGDNTRGAAVVMDVRTGDLLALASSPSFDPNDYIRGASAETRARLNDPKLRPQINRATQENYAPGSIFKTVTGMACLEHGLNPAEVYEVQPDPREPYHGYINVGRMIKDTAKPGPYNFRRALINSSNAYFITNGLRYAGIEGIAKYAHRLHLGEPIGLPTLQETKGIFPSDRRIHADWSRGDTANICIGQGEMAITPLQMAVLAAALANGGKVLWPRLIDRIESQDPLAGEAPLVFPKGRVRDQLGLRPSTQRVLADAMLADVEDQAEGTGRAAFIPGFRICSKTGTAQNERNGHVDKTIATTWFLSYAPYESPRYAVVVMVESGASGGGTCAPLAKQIYETILQVERSQASTLAEAR